MTWPSFTALGKGAARFRRCAVIPSRLWTVLKGEGSFGTSIASPAAFLPPDFYLMDNMGAGVFGQLGIFDRGETEAFGTVGTPH